MSNLVVLNTGPKAAEDLSKNLRVLADEVDNGLVVKLILACVSKGEYEIMVSAPLTDSLVLASLLHKHILDSFEQKT